MSAPHLRCWVSLPGMSGNLRMHPGGSLGGSPANLRRIDKWDKRRPRKTSTAHAMVVLGTATYSPSPSTEAGSIRVDRVAR